MPHSYRTRRNAAKQAQPTKAVESTPFRVDPLNMMDPEGGNGDAEVPSGSILHKTKICKFFELGMCQRGPMCGFAHSEQEMHQAPDLFRTKLCPALISGVQCHNPQCRYAHRNCEIRQLDGAKNNGSTDAAPKRNSPPAKQSTSPPEQRPYEATPVFANNPMIPVCPPDPSFISRRSPQGAGNFGGMPIGMHPGPGMPPGPIQNYDGGLGLQAAPIFSQERGVPAGGLVNHAHNLLDALQQLQDRDNVQEALRSAQELVSQVNGFLQKFEDNGRAPPQGHWNGNVSNSFHQVRPNGDHQYLRGNQPLNDAIPQMDVHELRNTLFKFMEEVKGVQQQGTVPYNNVANDYGHCSPQTMMQSWDERKNCGGMPQTPSTAENDGLYQEDGCNTFSRQTSWVQSNGSDNSQRDEVRDGFVQSTEIGMQQKCAEDMRNTPGNTSRSTNGFGQKAAPTSQNFGRQTSPYYIQGYPGGFGRQTSPCYVQGTGILPDYPAEDFASCYGGFSRQTTIQAGEMSRQTTIQHGGFSRQTTVQQYEQVFQNMSMDVNDDDFIPDSHQGGFSRKTSPYANYAHHHEDATGKAKGISMANALQSSPTNTHGSLPDGDSTSYGCGSFSRQSTEDKGEEIRTDNFVAEWSRQQSHLQTTNGHGVMSRQTSNISDLQQGDMEGCTKALTEISSSLGLRLTVKSTFLDCDPLSDEDTTCARRLKRSASFQFLSRNGGTLEEEIEDIATSFDYRQVTC
jgi:hypothetical protein